MLKSPVDDLNFFKISENFDLNEFASPDTFEVKISAALVNKLQRLRTVIGGPVRITSGYRTPERNKEVGGEMKSLHMIGEAVDVFSPGVSLFVVTAAAIMAGFPCVIAEKGKGIVHCALGPRDQIIVPGEWTHMLKTAFPEKKNLIYWYEKVFPGKW